MNNQKSPSLFLPKLAAILFVAIFLSGMTEIVFIASTKNQEGYSLVEKTSQLFFKPHHAHPIVETSSDVFSKSSKLPDNVVNAAQIN